MKLITFLLIAFVTSYSLHAQHTERFMTLTQDIKPSKKSKVKTRYKDGTIKEEGRLAKYKMPEYTYYRKVGTYTTYYKNGAKKSITEYDAYGNILSTTFYNKDGSTWWKSKTLEIDSTLDDPAHFFATNDHYVVTKWDKELKFGPNIGKMYIKTEGKIINGKKVGVWKVYDEEGRLEEEINY